MKKWKLKRTKQCAKCPWRKDVDPTTIPDGYSVEKHKALKKTIVEKSSTTSLMNSVLAPQMQVMACHETADSHCIGWLANQLGVGNHIGLRMQMINCENADKIETVGEQHETFEETLPT